MRAADRVPCSATWALTPGYERRGVLHQIIISALKTAWSISTRKRDDAVGLLCETVVARSILERKTHLLTRERDNGLQPQARALGPQRDDSLRSR